MKVQQAPSPVQASLLSPATVAWVIAHSKKDGTTSHSSASTRRVSSVFATELKRLRRSQSTARAGPPCGPPPPGKAAASAGASAVMTAASAPARSSLHQGDAPVVPVHEGREEQVDGQEDRHHDDDDLDLLARLVHHRAGEDLEDLGVGDGGAERAALDQVEILAGQLRHHDAQRLRQDDQEKHAGGAQAEGAD